MPAMCSMKDPCRVRRGPCSRKISLSESANKTNSERERERERRKPLEGLLFLMALLVGGHWPLCHHLRRVMGWIDGDTDRFCSCTILTSTS